MRTKRRKIGAVETWAAGHALSGVAAIVRRLPFPWLPALGAAGGDLAYAVLARRRAIAHANLRRAFGDRWDEAALRRVARQSCGHMATNLWELVSLARLEPAEWDRRVRVTGREHLEAALRGGAGVILVSAHYGSWEVLLAWLTHQGYAANLVQRQLDHPALQRILCHTRMQLGQHVMFRKQAAPAALRCLRRNEPLLMMVDQHGGDDSLPVEFFGAPAATATGPAVLSLRTGAPLLPAFCTRLPGAHYEIEFHAPIAAEAGESREQAVARLTTLATQAVEARVRARPEQWLWLHNRWKQPGENRLRR